MKTFIHSGYEEFSQIRIQQSKPHEAKDVPESHTTPVMTDRGWAPEMKWSSISILAIIIYRSRNIYRSSNIYYFGAVIARGMMMGINLSKSEPATATFAALYKLNLPMHTVAVHVNVQLPLIMVIFSPFFASQTQMLVSMPPDTILEESGDQPMHMARAVWNNMLCFNCKTTRRQTRTAMVRGGLCLLQAEAIESKGGIRNL